MKISILCSDVNHPVVNHLHNWIKKILIKGHNASLVFDRSDLPGGDILFLVSCSQVILDIDRYKYKASLVLHASDLPKGRGWSPHIWSILAGNSLITVTALEATEPIDSGLIWMKTTFNLEGHELVDEINAKLFKAELYLMTQIVEQFADIKPVKQVGKPDQYMRKRNIEDSRIDPYRSISDQFNLLRVADPERYPAFFDYRGIKYLIKIEKAKSE
jgi:methionyl-tRNA formyltransferase